MLSIVGTPLGNLGDMTFRGVETLKQADEVWAEDTRVTGQLLSSLGISVAVKRLDENTMRTRIDGLLDQVRAGKAVAYCSDAGMPGISDPGLRLVDAAYEADLPVEVVPGPSAVDTAYVASGTSWTNFYFGGFFPRKTGEQKALLDTLASLEAALIFYESPHRVLKSVEVLAERFPYRQAALCRELTKLHQEIIRAELKELMPLLKDRQDRGILKGEMVLVIDGPSDKEKLASANQALGDAESRLAALRSEGFSTKEMTKQLMKEFGLSRNAAYDLVLKGSEH